METLEQLPGMPTRGRVLAGKYRIERVLGAGGMGVVVSAMHLQLGGRVAIKMLHPAIAQNADAVARFGREARALGKIKSEHAVRVFDVGTLDGGAPYMVMEQLEGADLAAIVAEHGPLPVADAVDYVLQASEALAEAHALGIAHGDLKPANLFLSRSADGWETVKVLDFGIAGEGANAIVGSPQYMSPEQMRSSRAVGVRSDIWALGSILSELISGAPPFRASTPAELCVQILEDAPASLGHVPAGLEAVVCRCLAKSPNERFVDLAELAAALCEFGSARAARSRARIARTLGTEPVVESGRRLSDPPPPAISPLATSQIFERPASRRWPSFAVTGLLVLGVLALAASAVAAASHVSVAASPASAEIGAGDSR
jgi:serine/threonine protein kinase